MCMQESKPRASSDCSTASIESHSSVESTYSQQQLILHTSSHQRSYCRSLVEIFSWTTLGAWVAVAVVAFSLTFPFLLAPDAAAKTYKFAWWNYDSNVSLFDNTAWTYGTDYFLGISMLILAANVPSRQPFTRSAWLSRGLLGCYMLSVFAGAVSHQFFTTVHSRNTVVFRFLWSVCVGTVSLASGFMGATARELDKSIELVVPDSFWVGYAVTVTAVVLVGGFSFQRPACDIFIAGITQSPSTFYMMLVLTKGRFDVSFRMRVLGCLGFILNAPLLPMYPILVQHTDLSLASVNTLLHSWLLMAWSLQGLALRHVGQTRLICGPKSSNSSFARTELKVE